jgi:PIN domain nuclease of toxin-antitoxin system
MKLLLDTHIFLWFISGSSRLSDRQCSAICDPDNDVYLSIISIWEVIIKHQLGKLPLPESPEIYLPRQRDAHQIASLNLDEGSVAQLANLPPLHRDPFDRMLICQALHNDLTIVTVDLAVLNYDVDTLN